MKLAKRIQLKPTPLLDNLCAISRGLYNVANWLVRQDLFNIDNLLFYEDLHVMCRDHALYVLLQEKAGAHAPQQVLRQVAKAWKGFFAAIKAFKHHPDRFRGRPKPPGYKRRDEGNVVSFTNQQVRVKDGFVRLPEKLMMHGMPAMKTNFTDEQVIGVRIVPHGDRYSYEILHDEPAHELGLDKKKSTGIDLGLNNLATTSGGFTAKGGAVKSVNQYYNKLLAKRKSIAAKVNGTGTTRYIKKLGRRRNDKIHDAMHKASRAIINRCIDDDIGTIFIGYNPGWKDGINMGKRNNQNFVQVPLFKLVSMIGYKATLAGIDVHLVTEEFTSQTCSRCGLRRKANRVHRGLYRCKRCGLVINADVNAARNIRKKGIRERQPVPGAVGEVVDRSGLDPLPEIKAGP